MAVAVNAAFLVAAITFIVLSYLTDSGAHGVQGAVAVPWGLSVGAIYRLAIWLGPASLAALAVHLTATSVLAAGVGITLWFMPVAGLVLLAAVVLAVQVWRRA